VNGIKDGTISSNGGKLSHEFYCTVSQIVATVVSLIKRLGGAVGKLGVHNLFAIASSIMCIFVKYGCQ